MSCSALVSFMSRSVRGMCGERHPSSTTVLGARSGLKLLSMPAIITFVISLRSSLKMSVSSQRAALIGRSNNGA